jgi:hypothetical protein
MEGLVTGLTWYNLQPISMTQGCIVALVSFWQAEKLDDEPGHVIA